MKDKSLGDYITKRISDFNLIYSKIEDIGLDKIKEKDIWSYIEIKDLKNDIKTFEKNSYKNYNNIEELEKIAQVVKYDYFRIEKQFLKQKESMER